MGLTIPSPCIGICFIDEDIKLCIGCSRTLEEIADWLKMDNIRKQEIVDRLNGKDRQV